ncbi:MAG: VOC family protein [Steroidobacteraceae bacterium]
MRRLAALLCVALGLAASSAALAADAPAPFTKLLKYVQTIKDMDRAYAFYLSLGLEPQGPPSAEKKLADNPGVARLTGSPAGTQFRNAFLKVPGADFQFEFTEFAGLEQKAIRPRMQDPGASLLVLRVRDIAKTIEIARKGGAEIVTLGGAPLPIGPQGKTRIVFLRDPEGYFVELVDASSAGADAPSGNIVGASFASVVEDAKKAGEYYRDHFGLEARFAEPVANGNDVRVVGLEKGQFERSTVTVPGSNVSWMFVSYGKVEKKAYAPRVTDPGAPAIGIQTRNFDGVLAAYKGSGGTVVSADGEAFRPGGNAIIFVRDPFGLLVEVNQPAPPK